MPFLPTPGRRPRRSATFAAHFAVGLAATLCLCGCPSPDNAAAATRSHTAVAARPSGVAAPVPAPVAESPAATPRPQLERDAFNAVNVARLKSRLPPLEWNDAIAHVARKHAHDLVAMGRLDHRGSNGSSLKDRIAGLRWVEAAENLARNKGFADPVAQAVKNWIQSTEHARSLYSPRFRQTGVGVVRGPDGFIYFVQVFTLPPER